MATLPESATPPPSAVRPSRNARPNEIVRVGLPRSYFDDLYHFLLVARWSQLLGLIGAAYVSLNTVFAGLYLLGGDVIAGAEPGSFRDAFFFSVQTLSTIGYGTMSPKGMYGSSLVTFEAFVGLLGVAMASGLMFGKFARPTARVMFTKSMVIGNRDGKPCLMFRMANQRANDVVEAAIRVSVIKEEVTAEGERLRRIYDLKLIRSHQPLFLLTWMAMHMIDESSPLYGETEASMTREGMRFIVTFTGIDGTFATTIHARNMYEASDIVWGGRYADVIGSTPDGRVMVDFGRFDTIEPRRPGEALPTTKPAARHEAAYEAWRQNDGAGG
jgi:inward rectifier potassium channel